MKYSIIIPHKNAPDLLQRCVDSIPQRDDLEIIISDDHSSKEIVDFAHFPGSDRENIRIVFVEQGKGAGNARNTAISMAKGDYLIFADCDDFFNDCFNDILNDYANTEHDVIYFNANSVDSLTYKPSNRVDHLHGFYDIYHKDHALGVSYFRYMFTEPWCKIIKRSLVMKHQIRFGQTIVVQDVVFAIHVGDFSRDICIDERQGYCVTSREGSLGQTDSPEAHEARFYVHAMWNKFLMDRNVNITIPRFEYFLYRMSQTLYKSPKVFFHKYKVLRRCGYSHGYIVGRMKQSLMTTLSIKCHRSL